MKKTIYTIVFAVLVIAAAAAVYYNYHEKNKAAMAPVGSSQQASGQPTPKYVAPGSLAAGLPKPLVLGSSPVVDSSYDINYASGTQGTAVYHSSSTIASLFNDYLAYFKSNKYSVINKSDTAKIASIYAIINGGADVNVLIVPSQTKGMNSVTVSYLKR